MNSQTIKSIAIGLFALTCLNPARAQSTFGSIVGSAQDASGAAIPEVAVTVTNLDDNTVRTTVSDNSGEYQVLNLRPGKYEIKGVK